MQAGTLRELVSEKGAWSSHPFLVHCWSRNVLVVAAEAAVVPEAVEAQAAREEAQAAQEEAQAGRAVPVAEAALEERAAQGVQAEPAAAEGLEEQAVQGARAEQVERVEELPGEAGAAYPTRI